MKNEEDVVRLKHALQAIELIEEFCTDVNKEDFFNDKMVQSVVVRQLEIIGEASFHISDELKLRHDIVEWE